MEITGTNDSAEPSPLGGRGASRRRRAGKSRMRTSLVLVMLLGTVGLGSVLASGASPGHGFAASLNNPGSYRLTGSATSANGLAGLAERVHPLGSPGDANLTLSPTHGFVGIPLAATGIGYGPNLTILLQFSTTSIVSCTSGALMSNSTGAFNCTFPVPVSLEGVYVVSASDGTTVATANFTVEPPSLAIVPGSGLIGSEANVTGLGYAPSTPLTLTFGTNTVSTCTQGSTTSTATGALSCLFQVPPDPAGFTPVNATDGTNRASTTFVLLAPTLALLPTTGVVASNVSASGAGYAPLTAVALTLDSITIPACTSGSFVSNSTGALSCTFAVPTVAAGSVPVNATDGINRATTTFVVKPPTLTLTPPTGFVGSSVVATGAGYAPRVALTVTFGTLSVSSCAPGSLTSNRWGGLNCTFSVPTVPAGSYSVNATDGTNRGTANYVVGPPTLLLSPSSGFVGDSLAATGAGYEPSTLLTITFGSVAIGSCTVGSMHSTPQGDLSCTFTVPHATAGSHLVQVTDGTNTASASYIVLPNLVLSPVNGTVGSSVTATGTGFGGTSSYALDWNVTTPLCAGTTDPTGGFTCSFLVPVAAGGGHLLTAQVASNQATAGFTVLPAISLNPTAGHVGRTVNLAVTGIDASAIYTVLWDGVTTVCSGSTDANGQAACSFAVPAAPQGSHTVQVREGSYTPTTSFSISPNLVLQPAGGAIATPVDLDGTGFAASSSYTACFQANVSVCPSGSTITTVANGSTAVGTILTVPALSPGAYYVDVSQSGSFVASAPFAVTSATLEVTPVSGPVGTSINLTGGLFDPSTQYIYCLQPTVAACTGTTVFTTDSSGNIPFGVVLTVSAVPGGTYYVDVSRGGLVVALASFTLTPFATIAPTSGAVGAFVEVTANGLDAGAVYRVAWNASVDPCSGTTDSTGALSCIFAVPASPGGNHTLVVAEGGYAPTVVFDVLSSLLLGSGSGPVGASIAASGTGFNADTSIFVGWNATVVLCTVLSNVNGAFGCSFPVPPAPEGVATVFATDGTHRSTVPFDVTPSAKLSRSSGTVGSTILLNGSGLPAVTTFSVLFGASTSVCSGTTTALGSLSCSVVVPATAAGAHNLTLTVGSTVLTLTYSVVPASSLSQSIGFVGTSVTLAGTGFDALAAFSVAWNSTVDLCVSSTNANGSFSCVFQVPLASGGNHTINVSEKTWLQSLSFVIAPHTSLSPSVGAPGTLVTAVGTGLAPNHPAFVSWNSTVLECKGNTTSNGEFSCAFYVPTTAVGTYGVTISDGVHTPVGLFTVNATVPVTPSSSGAAFPWWVVAISALAVIAILGAVLLYSRRRPARRPGPSAAAVPVVSSTGLGGPEGPQAATSPEYLEGPPSIARAEAVPAAAAAEPQPTGPVPDIDRLIEQLDRIAAEILKRPSPPEPKEGSAEAESEERAEASGEDAT